MAILNRLRRRCAGLGRRLAGACGRAAAIALAIVCVQFPTEAAPPIGQEYEIKAAFLFNFAKFTQWPDNAFTASDDPLRMCVLGDDPFGTSLARLVAGESINDRTVRVIEASYPNHVTACHLLFVSRSESWRMHEILHDVAARGVLTVSEMDEFASNGGNLNFFIENSRVRFEINPASVRRNGLRVSAQLMQLGRVVADRSAVASE